MQGRKSNRQRKFKFEIEIQTSRLEIEKKVSKNRVLSISQPAIEAPCDPRPHVLCCRVKPSYAFKLPVSADARAWLWGGVFDKQ
jgi:hypothetical protein